MTYRTCVSRFGGSTLLACAAALVNMVLLSSASAASINLVQASSTTPQSTTSTVVISYPHPQSVGDLNIVVVGWNDTSASVQSVKDSSGNNYSLANGPIRGTRLSQSIYFAKNIASGNNSVTVTFSQAAAYPDIRILEYAGLSKTSPLDVTAAASGSSGSDAVVSSGAALTNSADELIVGAGMTNGGFTTAGTGFASQVITADGDIAESEVLNTKEKQSATATLGSFGSQNWIMHMIAWKTDGGGGSPKPIEVSVSPTTVTLEPGQSTQFTAQVTGASSNAITWTASQGKVSSSGVYTAPSAANGTEDTVSAISAADPTYYANASVAIQSPSHQKWTALNQQPATQEFFPNSLWTTPLPTTGAYAVQNHYLNNSNAMVQNLYSNSDYTETTVNCLSTTPNGNGCSNQRAFYYASESDPVYCVTSVTSHPPQTANNPSGKCFHLAAGAPWSSYNTDQTIAIWDQSSDIDSTAGGRILSAYRYCGSTCPLSIPSDCTARTPAQARSQSACQLSLYYGDMSYPDHDPLGGIQDGMAWMNDNSGTGSSFTRDKEVIDQTVNHAIAVNAICVTPGPSWPSDSDGNSCAHLSQTSGEAVPNPLLAPHVGTLFWVDEAYDCATRGLRPPQVAFCKAMQTYGAYMTATGGDYFGQWNGLFMDGLEGPIAEHFAGASDPVDIFRYLDQYSESPGTPIYCTGSPVTRCNFAALQGWPGLIEGDASNGHKPHLHMIDPCVPKSVVGMKASCSGSPAD